MMNNALQLLKEMNNQLEVVAGLPLRDPQGITHAITIVAETLAKLQSYILSEPFNSEAEEIQFFKQIKPQLDGRMVFYLMLLRMVSCSTAISVEDQRSIYLKELSTLRTYYDQHYTFWMYYRMDHNYLDTHYFLRNAMGNTTLYDEEQLHYDHRTNALMSAKAARFHAYELFKEHIGQALLQMDRSVQEAIKSPGTFTLTWTSPIVALVELIYALQEYGVFNNTSVDIKKIADYFSLVFHVRLNSIYKAYEDIRLRKKNPTPFLDALKASLEKRIDRDNEHAM